MWLLNVILDVVIFQCEIVLKLNEDLFNNLIKIFGWYDVLADLSLDY